MRTGEEVKATTPLRVLFWITVVVSIITFVITIIGNGMVIFVGCRKQKTKSLKNLNNAVRSLAIADLLFGIVGMPVITLYSYWGKSCVCYVY